MNYPTGAKVRAVEICRHPKTGRPGLLPIHPVTWWRWVKDGKVPQGERVGRVTWWPIEQVLSLGQKGGE